MSESGSQPPSPFAQPIPAQPLPTQSIPAQSLPPQDYATPGDYGYFRRRPGIITAIGILSITIGSLGLITGGISGLYGGALYMVSQMANAMQSASVAAVKQPLASTSTSYSITTQRGLDPVASRIAVTAFAQRRPLSDARKRQLDALLAQAGLDMFVTSSDEITTAKIRGAITDTGQLPSASNANPNAGPDFFVIATGRVEIYDDHAIYEPAERSQETVRAAAPLPDNADEAAAAMPLAAGSNLSRGDLQTAMQMIDRLAQNRITAPQRQTIRAEFATGTGLLLPPSAGVPIPAQSPWVTVMADGSLFVTTAHGQMQVDPAGNVRSRMVYSTAANPFGGNGKMSISGASAAMVVSEAAASILLSIYLLVIGILTLRQNPRGRQLHFIYAILKIPLAILCGIGWCWLIGGFFSSLPNAGGSAAVGGARAFLLASVTGVAIIYPVALLITFLTPTVKRYYDTGQG